MRLARINQGLKRLRKKCRARISSRAKETVSQQVSPLRGSWTCDAIPGFHHKVEFGVTTQSLKPARNNKRDDRSARLKSCPDTKSCEN